MLTYSIILFAVAAVGGLILAAKILRGQQAPWELSILHALLGAAGLIVLGVVAWELQPAARVTTALALLVIAALAGFYLASIHFRGNIAPAGVVVIHAGVAVTGFLLILSVKLGI